MTAPQPGQRASASRGLSSKRAYNLPICGLWVPPPEELLPFKYKCASSILKTLLWCLEIKSDPLTRHNDHSRASLFHPCAPAWQAPALLPPPGLQGYPSPQTGGPSPLHRPATPGATILPGPLTASSPLGKSPLPLPCSFPLPSYLLAYSRGSINIC